MDKHSCDTKQIQGGDEDECDNGNGCEQLHGCSSVSEENAANEKTQPCPVLMILVELPRGTETNLAESRWAGGVDCPAGACLLGECWVTGGAGAVECLLVHGFLLVPGSTLVSVL